MGLKSIELQVAIPRSQDAGKMQEQMTRQGQQFQETLTQQQLREEIINRGKINPFEKVEDRSVTDKEDRKEKEHSEDKEQDKHHNKDKIDHEQSIQHPYLGTKIDYSG